MPRLRVATYNLYLGADLALLFDVADAAQLAERVGTVRAQLAATSFAERAVAVARLLARERPDLVGLQEVARWTATGPDGQERVLADFLASLLAALEDAGCGYDAHAVDTNFSGALPVDGGGWMGLVGANAVLARRDGPVRVTGEDTGDFVARHRVVTDLGGVSFPIARGWSRVRAEVAGRSLVFVCTHTEAYDEVARDAQRDELLAVVGDPGVPVVLAGDFNATPDRVGLGAPYVDAWAAAGRDGTGDTIGQAADLANPESRLRERIDYLFVRDARVRACRVVGDRQDDRSTPSGLWPSDHAGVVADLEV